MGIVEPTKGAAPLRECRESMVLYPAALPRKGVAWGDSESRALPWGIIPFISGI